MVRSLFVYIVPFILGCGLALGVYRWQHRPAVTFLSPVPTSVNLANPTPSPTLFSLETAPRDSLLGSIATMSGVMWWQSRTATQAARLNEGTVLQQGETLIASDSGELIVDFAGKASIALLPKAKVEIVQTLPQNLVFQQTRGHLQYAASKDSPISVRANRLLVYLPQGAVQVKFEADSPYILVTLKEGEATVAYNDKDFVSQVIKLSPGEEFEFDNEEREGVIL